MPRKIVITGRERWWDNFVLSINTPVHNYADFMKKRDIILKNEYRAEIESGQPYNSLVFEDERYATMFVLRWS